MGGSVGAGEDGFGVVAGLGREGAVCPFTSASIKKNLFRVAFVHGNNIDYSGMVGLLNEIAAAFPLLSPAHGPESIFKAVVVVFPDVTEFEQFDAVQKECKDAFVKRSKELGFDYQPDEFPVIETR